MSEWFEYQIGMKDKNIARVLIDAGLAQLVPHKYWDRETGLRIESETAKDLEIFLDKIDQKIAGKPTDLRKETGGVFGTNELTKCYNAEKLYYTLTDVNVDADNLYDKDTLNNTAYLDMKENTFWYFSKAYPNILLPTALSSIFPDEIITVKERAPFYAKDTFTYTRNGYLCNREGEKLKHIIWGINPKLVAIKHGRVEVSLPIGKDENKWGKYYTETKNVGIYHSSAYEYDDTGHIIEGTRKEYSRITTIFFTEDIVRVQFKNGSQMIPVEQIIDSFRSSMDQYREYANKSLTIHGHPMDLVQRTTNSDGESFYIVTIFVPTNVSPNGYITISVFPVDVEIGDENGTVADIFLGKRGNLRSVYTYSGDTKTREYKTHEEIFKYASEIPQRTVELESEGEMEI